MDDTNVLLFGIAVILFGGFYTLGHATAFAGSPFETIGYLIMVAGLGICILGPLANRFGTEHQSG